MTTKVVEWRDVRIHKSGNSWAVYLPRDVARKMGAHRRRKFQLRYFRGKVQIRIEPAARAAVVVPDAEAA